MQALPYKNAKKNAAQAFSGKQFFIQYYIFLCMESSLVLF